jgi:ABC-type sulfate transport system permease component
VHSTSTSKTRHVRSAVAGCVGSGPACHGSLPPRRTRVLLPLLRRTLLMNWLLVFIPSLRELSTAMFLFTPGTAVRSTLIFDLSDAGNYESVSTLGVLMMRLTFALVSVACWACCGAVVGQRRTA